MFETSKAWGRLASRPREGFQIFASSLGRGGHKDRQFPISKLEFQFERDDCEIDIQNKVLDLRKREGFLIDLDFPGHFFRLLGIVHGGLTSCASAESFPMV